MSLMGVSQVQIGIEQLLWLANTPLDMLGNNAMAVYKWISDDLKLSGFIPIDNREYVLGE